jgi:hypothetical protein
MEFFDKKQDVINLKLTRYGRQLLSIGQFKPVYYAFSDDGVLYDSRWISGSAAKEEQWLVEQRIQEQTPRVETISSKVGTERTVFNTADLSAYALDKNLKDLFNLGETGQDLAELEEYKSGKLTLDPDYAESERLFTNLLGTKRYFNNKAPGWNMLLYHGMISSSSNVYQKNKLKAFIPQVNSTLYEYAYMVPEEDNPEDLVVIQEKIKAYANSFGTTTEDVAAGATHAATPLDDFFEVRSLPTGSVVLGKDFLFLSVEESNVDFENENFILEVFEVTQTDTMGDTESLNKLLFYNPASVTPPKPENLVGNLFDVKVDEEVAADLACFLINSERKLKTKNIYVTNVYDCEEVADTVAGNKSPYELPPVDAEDVC